MGIKFNWTGLFFILALLPLLKVFGFNGSEVLVAVGSVLFGIGVILMWLNK